MKLTGFSDTALKLLLRCSMAMCFCLLLKGTVLGTTPTIDSNSTTYTVQSTVAIAVVSGRGQKSAMYEVSSLVDKANNGLAIGSSTKMIISWPIQADADGIGFDIYSSTTGKSGSFARMNDQPVPAPPYEAQYHANGTYYYLVYYIDSMGFSTQWTEVFSGTITGVNAAKYWSLYE